MPNVLYMFRPPPNWITFKRTQANARKLPPPKRDVHGNIIYEQWPMDPNKPQPLLDFKHLPDRVGTREFWWVFEAWRRYDPRIRWKDIWMRQERSHRSSNPTGNGIHMLVMRNRASHKMVTWTTDNGPSSRADWINEMTDQQRQDNTTRGLTPGLINPALGEAGGRVPLPDLIKGAGEQKRKVGERKQKRTKKDKLAADKHGTKSPETDYSGLLSDTPRPSLKKKAKTQPKHDFTPTQAPSTAPSDPYRSHYLAAPPAQMIPPISPYQVSPDTDPTISYPRNPYVQSYQGAGDLLTPNLGMQAQGPTHASNVGPFPGSSGELSLRRTRAPQNVPRTPFDAAGVTTPIAIQENTQPLGSIRPRPDNLYNFSEDNAPDAVAGTNEPLQPITQQQHPSDQGYYIPQDFNTQFPNVPYLPRDYRNYTAPLNYGSNPPAQSPQGVWTPVPVAQRQSFNVPSRPYAFGPGVQYQSQFQLPSNPELPIHDRSPTRDTMRDPNDLWQSILLDQRQPFNSTNFRTSTRDFQHPGRPQPLAGPSLQPYASGPRLQHTYHHQPPSGQPLPIYNHPPAPAGNTTLDPSLPWSWTHQTQEPQQPQTQHLTARSRQPSHHTTTRTIYPPHYQPPHPGNEEQGWEYGLPPHD
ncbi:MAG: hypothetical protein LQ343_000154 [Gyalolechia ehrenbergii]|nr:MAG: hypothetical protein LQ343_000154 [Gyalolechia ehrenbergii]